MTNIIVLFIFIILMMSQSLKQLSFSGGGSFGAIEIGILKRVIELEKKNFDLYTGISAGALNAGFLSYYSDISEGINNAEKIYSNIKNKAIYNFFPTKVSILNTKPLHHTLTNIITSMNNKPVVHTLIGTTNIYSGKLDIYNFEEQDDLNKVLLLMSSCAIPGIFPPIKFNNELYADGGILSNELIQVEHDNLYLNITFITPYQDFNYDYTQINSLKSMLCRTSNIILNNFNSPTSSLNQNCKIPIGEINKYYVSSKILKGYNMLNFNKGNELINLGYENTIHKKYIIC